MRESRPPEFSGQRGLRFHRFQDLMHFRIREILLVSSLYDSFILSEDGSLYESLFDEYVGFGLTHMPNITRVTRGEEALLLTKEPGRFDLVITSLRLEDMHAVELSQRIKEIGIDTPIVLLTHDSRELAELVEKGREIYFDKMFVWQGDFRVLLSIIKLQEDRMNVEHDTRLVGVQSIIVVEDNVKYYSSYLPKIYTALLEHTAELVAEGVNPAHKLLQMRARPKILHCTTYEEAWECFEKYHDNILGVISDIEFPMNGRLDSEAGFLLASNVKRLHRDIPVLLQSRDPANRERAYRIGVDFLNKDSDRLLEELKRYMVAHFGFGDFIFRMRDGSVVSRATDLRSLEEQLRVVPDECVVWHGERNDFSTWLKARTEFLLAYRLRPVEVDDYPSIDGLREHLISSLREHRRQHYRGSIVDYDPDNFDEVQGFARIGSGSLGGKARGLAFGNTLIEKNGLENAFDGVRISIPPSIILGTSVFNDFLELNDLKDFALRRGGESVIERFLDATFPEIVEEALRSFLEKVRYPLSVRSSSLLEDSQFMPFAGVYDTFMLPNDAEASDERLADLVDAIKRVYASAFSQAAKQYMKTTPYRLEEEEMAVIVQMLVGSRHDDRFYPNFSGVARSHNFYPISPMSADDGIASVALGLGKQVVEGGSTVRFCPRYPRHLVQFSRVEDVLKYSQQSFFALKMTGAKHSSCYVRVVQEPLKRAETDGVLQAVGSTYSLDNHAIYDGVSREGRRVVTFAPILKYDLFPLPEILDRLLAVGGKGMSGPVEIEFAVNLDVPDGRPAEFYLLQMRPMVIDQELERLSILETHQDDLILKSSRVLGNGAINDIKDMIVVDVNRFDRAESVTVAREVSAINRQLSAEGTPYVLIGVGRWGSADPWLGIPVRWEDINGARVIVETQMRDIKVTPSEGTHFFQNITASKVGYITISSESRDSFVDWEWLEAQPAVEERKYVRHIRFEENMSIMMDGHHSNAVILKPGVNLSNGSDPE